MNFMRNKLKWLAVLIGGIIGGGIPLIGAYFAWSWAMTQVPISSEWAGLIKVGVSFLMIAFGGWIPIICAIGGGIIGALVIATVDPE